MKKVPKLRFKEFTGEWEEIKEEIKILSGNAYPLESYNITGNLLIQGLNIYPGKLILENPIYIEKNYSKCKHIKINKNDILLGLNRPIINNELKVCMFNEEEEAYLYQRAGILKFNKDSINSKFLYQYLRSEKFKKRLEKELVGSDQPYIKSNLFNIIQIYSGEIKEQEKIANFLSSVDKKISLTEEKLELFKNYKKGIMQKIFSQKLRFKDENGNDYPEWEEKKLGDILKEYIEKTTRNNQYQVLSSTATGIYLQEEYFKKQVASNDNTGYKILKKNQLVFSPQNLWLGNININLKYDIGIVSPSYKIFNINIDKVCIKYLKEIIKTTNMLEEYKNSSEQGASIVRRNLDMTLFIRILINLPCLEEQEKIANFLSSIDEKIEKIENELENLKEFKKGLLQQMFI